MQVLLVVQADGILRPIEVLWVSRVRELLDASHDAEADAVLRSFDGRAGSVGTLIADERCLHDLVVAAVIDGATHPAEQETVEAFIDAARIPRARTSAIIREALLSAESRRRQLVGVLGA